ncbi:glycosyltransferase family 4 protein [Vibrio alginolyticus]|uniref:glycosyltransferase family 4 protein n=1 Tax=Vibrio alginolyticus TaxID=663 RepID=UPI00124D5102|nr:glycosyltransferase family 4 protein [Vibrio alginolyticus]EGQ9178611.1 glycosyltransferase family 4 protein [Vibrio alginolyticus]KAB2115926.1 glycosyltransferase family 4 protein [Vibrio alginolyticus]MCR9572655.1 glycosyltransferase family 4 protein [Vibrio alginolyticus]ULF82355.1 glycosyltransferase family 4 protein [Vibrio alginolyticus]
MKKVLFVATIDQHIRHFHIPYLRWFKNKNFQVSVASNGNENVPYVDVKHEVSFERSPWSYNNFIAFLKLKKLLKENKYEIIHTHTPVASILVRLANFMTGKRSKIIYTAHGFHFYKGAKIFNWLIYYPVEKLLSFQTDTLITINDEDYNATIRNKFGCKNVYLVDGVGINLDKYRCPTDKEKLRLREMNNLSENEFVLIYVGELSKRKNQKLLLESIAKLTTRIDNLKLLLVGKGNEETNLRKQCTLLNLDNIVEFLGYRNDVSDLMKLSDLSVSTALQEGLPVNIMESLSSGLPCVVTNCRGNRDIINDGVNGFVVEDYDSELFSDRVFKIYNDKSTYKKMKFNAIKSVEKYSDKEVLKVMGNIYSECLGNKSE